jgi:hypothetical protein
MVSGDMKDNLAFIMNRQSGWTTRSYFVEWCIAFLEISKGTKRNIGDMVDFREGVSGALDQAQCSTSAFGSPLESLHDVFDKLQKNWGSIYPGGGGIWICN